MARTVRAGGGAAGDKPRRPTEKIVDGCHPRRRLKSLEDAWICWKQNLDVYSLSRERHGNAPLTSASPPVFTNGNNSGVTKRTFTQMRPLDAACLRFRSWANGFQFEDIAAHAPRSM
jgi:hypothetical protein